MRNVTVAFEILDEEKSPPIGWSKSNGHLVFDVKRTLLGRQDV